MTGELREAIESEPAFAKVWLDVGLAGYVGSIAHGTAGDTTDDVDVSGVFIAPIENYFGLTRIENLNKTDIMDKYDINLFEIRRYFELLLKCNPNVLTLLWIPDNMYIVREPWGKLILENRKMFLSKQLYKTFGGYAYGQLQRMTRCCTEKAYAGAKRRERYEKYGYDCKNAAHLIRLLRMGIEVLTTGEINVARHDAKQLKEIKYGQWKLEQVEAEAQRLQILLDEAFVRTDLPVSVNFSRIQHMLIDILKFEFF